MAPKNSYWPGIWLSNIISQGAHGGGWDRQRQHICCSRKIRQIMDGWAELCHTQNEMKSNWIKLFGLSIFIFPKNGPHQSFFYAPQKKKKNYLILPEKLFMTPSLDSHITAEPKSERYQLSQPNLTSLKNVCGIVHAQMWRKDDIFRQRQLNHYNIGVGLGGKIIGPIMSHSI